MDRKLTETPPSSPSTVPPTRGEWGALAGILLGSLALRLSLLPHRWINPDEGAHLMDGRLLLDGLVPLVDFESRQVLYVYALAGWLRLTGFHLETARLLPLGVSIAVGVVVFALTRRLFGPRAAVFATAVYAFFPLSVLWSANVHMQPIALLPVGLGFFFLAGGLDARPTRSAALAGVCFGLAFYVRETALAAVAAAVLFVAATAGTWTVRVRRVAALGAGFLLVSGIIIGGYSRVLTPSELWNGPLNPLALPLGALAGAQTPVGRSESVAEPEAEPSRVAKPAGPRAAQADPPRLQQQPLWRAISNIRLMAGLGMFLFVGLAASLRGFGRAAWRTAEASREAAGFLLLWLWFGLLALAYGYWTLRLGFYPQYFTELVPPLAIAFGVTVPRAVERWAGRELPPWFWVTVGLLLAGCFVTGGAVDLPTPVYLAAPALLLAAGVALAAGRRALALLALGALAGTLLIGAIPAMPGASVVKGAGLLGALVLAITIVRATGRPAGFDLAVMMLAAGTAVFSMQRAGRLLNLAYQCPWPPDLLAPAVRMIRERSGPDDQVMSGAVIWDFEAGRRPFLLISHPLKFGAGHTVEEQAEIEQGMAATPPRIVVLDGYTERTYGRVNPALIEQVLREYEPLITLEGGRYPVRLYRRPDSGVPR